MDKNVANEYKKVTAIMQDIERGVYVGGTSISPKGDVGIISVNGTPSIVRIMDSKWIPLEGYDMNQYIFEIIAYTSTLLEEQKISMPKVVELNSQYTVELVEDYIKYIEENIDEIYKIKENEKCSFSQAVFGQIYTKRRKKEIEYAKNHENDERNGEYFMH